MERKIRMSKNGLHLESDTCILATLDVSIGSRRLEFDAFLKSPIINSSRTSIQDARGVRHRDFISHPPSQQLPPGDVYGTGFYAGYVASAFTFGRFLGGYIMGVFTDSMGRKPVMIVGLLSMAAFSLAFGFSTSYTWAVSSRCEHVFCGDFLIFFFMKGGRSLHFSRAPENGWKLETAASGWHSLLLEMFCASKRIDRKAPTAQQGNRDFTDKLLRPSACLICPSVPLKTSSRP